MNCAHTCCGSFRNGGYQTPSHLRLNCRTVRPGNFRKTSFAAAFQTALSSRMGIARQKRGRCRSGARTARPLACRHKNGRHLAPLIITSEKESYRVLSVAVVEGMAEKTPNAQVLQSAGGWRKRASGIRARNLRAKPRRQASVSL